jgi:hypothetical protein
MTEESKAESKIDPTRIPDDHDRNLCWPVRYGLQRRGWESYASDYFGVFETEADALAGALAYGLGDMDKPRPLQWRDVMKSQCYEANPVVWAGEKWWLDASVKADHFVCVSRQDPTLLSYVQSAEKGMRGVRTPIKPGRYLKKFFGDVLSEKEIAYYAQWQSTGSKPCVYDHIQMQLATTPDDIESVYIRGPYSCMSSKSYRATKDVHPSRVYGAGDLAIAYLEWPEGETQGSDTAIFARALCWPEKKVFGRVYPSIDFWQRDGWESRDAAEQARDALTSKLRAAGYEPVAAGRKSFDGARLQKIRIKGSTSYVMPYLDSGYGISDDDRCFRMASEGGRGSSRADNTDGTIDLDDRGDVYVCAHCEDEVEDTDYLSPVVTHLSTRGSIRATESWCDCCRDGSSFYCDGLEEHVSDDYESVEIGGSRYSLSWAEAHGAYRSDMTDDWYFDDDEQKTIVRAPTATSLITTEVWAHCEVLEALESGRLVICAVSGEYYDSSLIVRCALSGRSVSISHARLVYPEIDAHTTTTAPWAGQDIDDYAVQAYLGQDFLPLNLPIAAE